jgi:SAM-dependent methyltransferase
MANKVRKLEIGSGNHPQEGYEHLDINPNMPHLEHVAPMDNLPLEDNIFDEVISIHVIEHDLWRNAPKILKEWVRVLKPGGKLYIATPNFRWVAEAYLAARNGNPEEFLKDSGIMTPEQKQFLNIEGQVDPGLWANFKVMSSGIPWDQHYAMFDSIILPALMREAGCSRTEVEYDKEYLSVIGYK